MPHGAESVAILGDRDRSGEVDGIVVRARHQVGGQIFGQLDRDFGEGLDIEQMEFGNRECGDTTGDDGDSGGGNPERRFPACRSDHAEQ